MADNLYVNKVVYGNTTLMDISDTTAEQSDVLQGKYFYNASGAKVQGTAITGVSDVEVDGTSVVSGGVASIDLTGKANVSHTHTTIDITNFPTLATVATSGDYTDLSNTPSIPTKTSDLINDSDFMNGMYIASYGTSTYAEVLEKYQHNHIIYCRAAGGTNPAGASKQRMAFLAYVNNMETPTEFEFQYYRSMSAHSNTNQGDEVWVYKLNKNTGWSYITRKTYTRIVANKGLTSTWVNDVLTINGFSGSYDDLTNKPTIPAAVSINQITTSGTNIADITVGETTTHLYAPAGGSGTVTDVEVDGVSVVSSGVASIDLTGKAEAIHTHVVSDITDFPTIPTDLSDLNNDMVVSDFSNDAGYITSYTETDPTFTASAAYGISASDISNWDGKADSSSLATVATSGDYNDLDNLPTIPDISTLLDLFYPIGSYYETSNTSFDPNVSWGGTWTLEAEGLVHIGSGANYTVGDTGGEKTHTLTTSEMPYHRHNVTADFTARATHYNASKVIFEGTNMTVTHDASTGDGVTQYNGIATGYKYTINANSSYAGGSNGTTQAHNNMQPYVVVNRWHRTA